MANEISVSALLQCIKSGVTVGGGGNLTLTQAGTNNIGNVQNIGTSSELAVVGDVTTIGYVFIKNLDATNYVEVDNVTGINAWPQKLLAGEFILLKPETATIYLKANTAACDVFICAFEL